MKPADYLDAAKKTLKLDSDYALAKAMEIDPGRLLKLRKGTRPMDEAEIVWLAVTLEQDAGAIMADLGAQRTKNTKKRELLRSFLSRAAVVAAICCTLALSFTAGGESAVGGLGGKRRRCYA